MLASAPLLLPKAALLLLSAFTTLVHALLPAPHDALFTGEILNFRLSPSFNIIGSLIPSDVSKMDAES